MKHSQNLYWDKIIDYNLAQTLLITNSLAVYIDNLWSQVQNLSLPVPPVFENIQMFDTVDALVSLSGAGSILLFEPSWMC